MRNIFIISYDYVYSMEHNMKSREKQGRQIGCFMCLSAYIIPYFFNF